MKALFLEGEQPYDEVRRLQEEAVEHRDELIIYCEHAPTFTFGRRTAVDEQRSAEHLAQELGFEVRSVDRGGSVTLHLPGQLVIYPVVDLRKRGLGVRRFVESGLSVLVRSCRDFGCHAEAALMPAGLYAAGAKIGAVGIRVVNGMTNHGFSLNVSCDLMPFQRFLPCGIQQPSSRLSDVCGVSISLQAVQQKVHANWTNELSTIASPIKGK